MRAFYFVLLHCCMSYLPVSLSFDELLNENEVIWQHQEKHIIRSPLETVDAREFPHTVQLLAALRAGEPSFIVNENNNGDEKADFIGIHETTHYAFSDLTIVSLDDISGRIERRTPSELVFCGQGAAKLHVAGEYHLLGTNSGKGERKLSFTARALSFASTGNQCVSVAIREVSPLDLFASVKIETVESPRSLSARAGSTDGRGVLTSRVQPKLDPNVRPKLYVDKIGDEAKFQACVRKVSKGQRSKMECGLFCGRPLHTPWISITAHYQTYNHRSIMATSAWAIPP